MKKPILFLILTMSLSSQLFMVQVEAAAKKTDVSLYQRLGGYNAITAVVDDLVPRLAKDKQLGRFWKHRGADGIEREKQLVVDFIANQAGGKLYYRGRDMKLSHKGMRISESDWRVLMKHLKATLDKFKLAKKERDDVIAFMQSTKDDMVELP